MWEYRPVTITTNSFAFCRYSVAGILWAALLLQNMALVAVATLILFVSFVLKVRNAPMVWIYRQTVERIWPSDPEVVDEKGIRFAHLIGTGMGVWCLMLYYAGFVTGAWITLVLFAILKTSAAFGFCSALKIYNCMAQGTCCRIGSKIRENSKNV